MANQGIWLETRQEVGQVRYGAAPGRKGERKPLLWVKGKVQEGRIPLADGHRGSMLVNYEKCSGATRSAGREVFILKCAR